jgi:hypothetical protein
MFCVGVGTICPMATAADPPGAPSASQPDVGFIAAVGAAAHDSIQEIQGSPRAKNQELTNLARAQIRAGDLSSARRVLAEVRSTPQASTDPVADLFALSMRAGDRDGALEFIRKSSDAVQLDAFGKLAVIQIKAGDFAKANQTIELIDTLYAKEPREAAPRTRTQQPLNFQTKYDYVLTDIGKALAGQGAIDDAVALVAKISKNGSRVGVMAEIAKAQHKSGNERGAGDSLQRLKEYVEELYGTTPGRGDYRVALAFAAVGDTSKAREITDALPDEERRNRLSQLSLVLAQEGDFVQARQMADASGDPRSLVLVGRAQHRAGDNAEAHKTFMAAYQALNRQSQNSRSDRVGSVGEIVDGLASAGAFSAAVSISKEINDHNRTRWILRVIKEEARQGDVRALRQTLPLALEIARAVTPFNGTYATDLAKALGEAGLMDDAKSVLGIAQENADRLSGWPRMDALTTMRAAQMALDDKEGVAKTEKAMQRETAIFNDERAQWSSQEGDGGKLAKAITLLEQADASADLKAEKELVQRASDVLGNEGMMMAVVTIWMRYSPSRQNREVATGEIARGNFAAAMTAINSLKGVQKDAGLDRLARAQADAGQLKPAFNTANAIGDPSIRAPALIWILGGYRTH